MAGKLGFRFLALARSFARSVLVIPRTYKVEGSGLKVLL